MWLNLLLIIVLIICVITDIKDRKIYNKVIFPSLVLAFLSHFFLGGWQYLSLSFIGFFVGLSLLLIPYFLGGMGAGDVKLLAFIGALKGPSFVFHTAIYMAIAGGIMALIILIFQRRLSTTLKSISYWFYSLKYGVNMPLSIHGDHFFNTYPYGIAIAIGAVLSLWLEGGMIL